MSLNYQKVVSFSASWNATTGSANYPSGSTVSGSQYQTIWPSNADSAANNDDMFRNTNVAISLVNYGTTTPSVNIEWSADKHTYETWNSGTFANLPVGVADSIQISMNSRRYLRLTTTGSLSGSILAVVSANG